MEFPAGRVTQYSRQDLSRSPHIIIIKMTSQKYLCAVFRQPCAHFYLQQKFTTKILYANFCTQRKSHSHETIHLLFYRPCKRIRMQIQINTRKPPFCSIFLSGPVLQSPPFHHDAFHRPNLRYHTRPPLVKPRSPARSIFIFSVYFFQQQYDWLAA